MRVGPSFCFLSQQEETDHDDHRIALGHATCSLEQGQAGGTETALEALGDLDRADLFTHGRQDPGPRALQLGHRQQTARL